MRSLPVSGSHSLFSSQNFPALGLTDGISARRVYKPCAATDTSCVSGTWEYSTDMTTPRWYPTVVTLSDGKAIIFSGVKQNLDLGSALNDPTGAYRAATNNPSYEYFPSKSTGSWPQSLAILDDAFPYNTYPISFLLPSGKVMLFVSNRTALIDPETDVVEETIPVVTVPEKHPWIVCCCLNLI